MSAPAGVPATTTIDLRYDGEFDLGQSIGFGFGQRAAGSDDVMRLAFVLDGFEQQVGVAVRQPAPDRLSLEVSADPDVDLEAVRGQVARVLSVDVDGRGYDELGRRDALAGRVQAARPGLRPPLFYSAYEAAFWAVLSARQPQAQMTAIRDRLAREHGRGFVVAGQEMFAAPLPGAALGLTEVEGLFSGKPERLAAVAQAALAGALDTAMLRALPVDEAKERVQQLPGIGPFYAELIVVRSLGHTDELAFNEPMVRDLVGQLVAAAGPLDDEDFAAVTESWRPWRTWVVVGVRAGATQLGLTPPSRRARGPRSARPVSTR